jgi:hypothetical protein
MKNLPGISSPLKGFFGKLLGTYARLVLTIQVIEDPWSLVIGPTVAERTYTLLMKFFVPSAMKFYADYLTKGDQTTEDAKWIADYILTRTSSGVTARELVRYERLTAADAWRIPRAMGVLIEARWVKEATTRRHDSIAWAVDPRVHTMNAERAVRVRAEQKEKAERIRKAQKNVRAEGFLI